MDYLTTYAKEMIEHSNSFIRAAAIELYFELFFYNETQNMSDLESIFQNVFFFETEAIVRRNCSKIAQKFDKLGSSSKIRTILLRALHDLDWEVKEEVMFF